jgi:hypothetical protein
MACRLWDGAQGGGESSATSYAGTGVSPFPSFAFSAPLRLRGQLSVGLIQALRDKATKK